MQVVLDLSKDDIASLEDLANKGSVVCKKIMKVVETQEKNEEEEKEIVHTLKNFAEDKS